MDMAAVVIAIVAANIDKFIVAYFSGVEVLSFYSLGYLVMTQVHAVFSASSSWVFPLISAKKSRGENLGTFYHNMQAIVVSFGFVTIAAALLLQKPLISLWLGNELAQQAYPFIRIYLFTNFFYTINIIPHHVLNGTGNVKHNTLSELVMKSVSIGLMMLFYYLLGDVGLIWGIVGALILTTPLKVGMTRKYGLRQSNLAFYPACILPGILIVATFSLNSPVLIALGTGLFVIAFYLIYLKPSDLSHRLDRLST
ncbi:MAG: oligosaccharide flippase family protein [Bacteroidia bacterium]|nr:oligosaccharide flippase family protein [Bacteroidia bacterium]